MLLNCECLIENGNLCIGYHMSGEVISVLPLEGRYYNFHGRAQRARDNYDIVTRVIQLVSCDNLSIIYLPLSGFIYGNNI